MSAILVWKPSIPCICNSRCLAIACMLTHNVEECDDIGISGFKSISCKYGWGRNANFDKIAITARFNSYGNKCNDRKCVNNNRSKGPSSKISSAIPLSPHCESVRPTSLSDKLRLTPITARGESKRIEHLITSLITVLT